MQLWVNELLMHGMDVYASDIGLKETGYAHDKAKN